MKVGAFTHRICALHAHPRALPPKHHSVFEHAVAVDRGETEHDWQHWEARAEACVGYLASAMQPMA